MTEAQAIVVQGVADKVMSLDGVSKLELIGDWLWIFHTKPMPRSTKITLRSLGFHPHSFRKGTWTRPGTPVTRSAHRELDVLRARYGSQVLMGADEQQA